MVTQRQQRISTQGHRRFQTPVMRKLEIGRYNTTHFAMRKKMKKRQRHSGTLGTVEKDVQHAAYLMLLGS